LRDEKQQLAQALNQESWCRKSEHGDEWKLGSLIP